MLAQWKKIGYIAYNKWSAKTIDFKYEMRKISFDGVVHLCNLEALSKAKPNELPTQPYWICQQNLGLGGPQVLSMDSLWLIDFGIDYRYPQSDELKIDTKVPK